MPLPRDPAETLRIAVFLAGNLARDEASDVLRQLGPRRAPSDPVAAAPTAPLPAAEESPEESAPRFWLGVSGEFDLLFTRSADQVCLLNQAALPINTAGYYCTDASGADFPSRGPTNTQNAAIDPSASDRVQGGAAPANWRAIVTFDYAADAHLLVGARLGYVLDTYPGQAAKVEGRWFPPVHAELRATYVFGHQPLLRVRR